MGLTAEYTTFTLDEMGRSVCNTLQEALASANQQIAGGRRDFDVIVLGGGTFGSVIAQSLFAKDVTHSRRILVLEAGPFLFSEHLQDTPFGQGAQAAFRTPWVADASLGYQGLLYAIAGRSLAWGGWSPEPLHDGPDDELIPWPKTVKSDLRDTWFEISSDVIGVKTTNDYIYGPLHSALRRLLLDGLTGPNGPSSAILAKLQDHPIVRYYRDANSNKAVPTDAQLRDWLQLPANDPTPRAELLDLLRLEAPLAVQSVSDPGTFPNNKFSGAPLIISATRQASVEANGVGASGDARKRIMVVPGCHVQELITETQPDNYVRVTGVRVIDSTGVSQDIFLTPPRPDGTQGVAVLALGTIESTRVALTTFQSSLAGRPASRMGKNLMAHLRSNLTIRVPIASLPNMPDLKKVLEVSALIVKGKASINAETRYCHLQITASGGSNRGTDSEAKLWRKVPDIDQVRSMKQADEQSVVITLRAIGEMSPQNPDNEVGLATTPWDTDFGRPKAFVHLGTPPGGTPSQKTLDDLAFWDAMDDLTAEVALIFGNGKAFEILVPDRSISVPAGATADDLRLLRKKDGGALEKALRDRLGTTHHDAGTLWMSDQPADGVTNAYGRIHDTTNCYVVGPALFPSTGSPNPMLTSVALARRTADMLTNSVLPKPAAVAVKAPFVSLFDGTADSYNAWTTVSAGSTSGFSLLDGCIVTRGGGDFGLLYHGTDTADFTLRVQFRVFDPANQNSGIFVRFRDPILDPTPEIMQRIQSHTNSFPGPTDLELFRTNRCWSAVYSGFEVQIDDTAAGDPRKDFYGIQEPAGLRKNRTGAIYKIPAGDQIPNSSQFDAALQQYNPAPNLRMGIWYEMEVDVRANTYTVDLTDLETGMKTRTTTYTNTDLLRGQAMQGKPASFVGLQSYPNSPVAFRGVQIKA